MHSSNWNSLLGIKLRKLRLKNNLSQSHIAYMLDISRNSYIEWESGRVDFSFSKLHKICVHYVIGLDELLKDLPPP